MSKSEETVGITFFRPVRPRFLAVRAAISSACVMLAVAAVACNATPQRGEAQSGESEDRLVTAAAIDTQHVVLSVRGMYCESCESTVTAMLRRTPGVLRADVSVSRGEAAVVYDAGRVSPKNLVDVVKTLGYTASMKGT